MAMKTYNPKKVTCALGRHIVVGYAEDSIWCFRAGCKGVRHMDEPVRKLEAVCNRP